MMLSITWGRRSRITEFLAKWSHMTLQKMSLPEMVEAPSKSLPRTQPASIGKAHRLITGALTSRGATSPLGPMILSCCLVKGMGTGQLSSCS